MKSIDWNQVRGSALDCLKATMELRRWADRSRQTDYDADAATQHLAAIQKASDTLWVFPGLVLTMCIDGGTNDPIRQIPLFDQLALASAHEIDRPDFGFSATAHEAALRLLIIALLHIEDNLKGDLTIEDLHTFSPKQRRDALCKSEKQDSMRHVVDINFLYKLEACVHREWSAVSAIPPPARAKAETTQGQESDYLEITVGDRVALRIVDGKTLTANFGRRIKPWEMFCELYRADHNGLARAVISKTLWPDQPVTDNALDQNKATVNKILETIRVEIKPDNRGVWRLAELNS
jgi:hypothetical protein